MTGYIKAVRPLKLGAIAMIVSVENYNVPVLTYRSIDLGADDMIELDGYYRDRDGYREFIATKIKKRA